MNAPGAADAALDLLIFSKDRACQLDGLLRTIRTFLGIAHRVHVLYTTSRDAYERGYDLLRRWHPDVAWVEEGPTFGLRLKDLVARIADGPSRFLMPLVDDMLFTRPFTATPLLADLERDDDVLAVSLRLGGNVDYCYTRNIATRPPDFSHGYRWAWKSASPGYWNYPMSTDGNVYRTREMAAYLPTLRFSDPNTLEAAMAAKPLPRPLLVCEPTPCVINLAVNLVQSTFANRHGDVSAESLNRAFLAGFALDVRPFAGKIFSACHIEAEMTLIADARPRERAVAPTSARGAARRVDLREVPCFVINLEKDRDERRRMEEQLDARGFRYEIVGGIQAEPSWIGIALAHLKVLRLSRAETPFLVLEDDCEFTERLRPVLEIPAEADALYLGVSSYGIATTGERSWGVADGARCEVYNEGYLRVHNMLARHAVLYLSPAFHRRAIESQVEALANRSFAHPGDIGMAMLQTSHLVLTPRRPVCRQRSNRCTWPPLQPIDPDGADERVAVPSARAGSARLEIGLRGGSRYEVTLAEGSSELDDLRALWSRKGRTDVPPHLVQLPLEGGHAALSFSFRDLMSLAGLPGAAPTRAVAASERWIVEALGLRTVLDVGTVGHDYAQGPFVPDELFDLIVCDDVVERVDDARAHHLLATLASARRAIVLGLPRHRLDVWRDRVARLGYAYDPERSAEATRRDAVGGVHGRHVFVRVEGRALPGAPAARLGEPAPTPARRHDPWPIHGMVVTGEGQNAFHLFFDVFVHPSRRKIVAVVPYYGSDWDPASRGIDLERVDMQFEGGRTSAVYVPHRLDSWEPCALLDFEHPALEALLRTRSEITCTITAGPHVATFTLETEPPPAFDLALSLVVKDENRWLRAFLEYYLRCLEVEHVFLYDNGTADPATLLRILAPYRAAGEVSYVPWPYRWRNRVGSRCAMVGQPAQQAHALNRFASCRWMGFFDVDELLRIPGRTLPAFLADYERAQVDGLSFGLRWFRPLGLRPLAAMADPPLSFRHSSRDDFGRKKQKLVVAPRGVRFLRLHWLEEGGRELAVDDADVFFHHYALRPERFASETPTRSVYDDHMLAFAERLTGTAPAARPTVRAEPSLETRPADADAWSAHVLRAFDDAEAGRSALSADVLAVPGMCGTMNRRFLNRLCSFAGCRYLEIGSLRGASTCAAVYGNAVQAVCLDNWSQFDGTRDAFEANVRRFAGASTVRLIEDDCFAADTAGLGPFDVYLYDGDHARRSQALAIERFVPTLAPLAVVIVDDWNWQDVREGTREGLGVLAERGEVVIRFEREILLRDDAVDGMPYHRGAESWWNGVGVFLLERPSPGGSRA